MYNYYRDNAGMMPMQNPGLACPERECDAGPEYRSHADVQHGHYAICKYHADAKHGPYAVCKRHADAKRGPHAGCKCHADV